jgi:transposase
MRIASIGIDLGKTTFHLVALGERSKVLVRKKFSRAQLLAYTANLPASLIGLEACAGAHFLGAALRPQGHQVRLIAAQFVKPYRKSNKNDFIDAEAIAEAVTKQNMRFVQIKTQEQLDWQAIHRLRDRLASVAPHCSTRSVAFCWSVASPFRRSLFTCAKISPQWWKMLSRT